MSREAMKRAFFAGWGRFDTSKSFDEKRATEEFEKWFDDQTAKCRNATI